MIVVVIFIFVFVPVFIFIFVFIFVSVSVSVPVSVLIVIIFISVIAPHVDRAGRHGQELRRVYSRDDRIKLRSCCSWGCNKRSTDSC